MHWIYFIPNQSFINILHGHKLVRLPLSTKYNLKLDFFFRFIEFSSLRMTFAGLVG